MTHKTYQMISGIGIQLHCICWHPTADPDAVLFIVHGLGEHSARYEEVATEFVSNNIAVFSFDHVGHGESEGKRGHAKSVNNLIEDIELALMKCRSIFLDAPIFMLGQSMGGQLAASFIHKANSNEVSGAIISSAWFELKNTPPSWQRMLIGLLEGIIPRVTLSSKLDSQHISSVKEEVELYEKDELIHDKISFALFHALYRNGKEILHKKKKVTIPVLVCHGELDQLTSVDASRNFVKNLGGKATFVLWKGSFHEPHHDHEKELVIKYYIDWVKTQI